MAFLSIIIADILVYPVQFDDSKNQWIETLKGILIRSNDCSWFPVITWGVFPIAGYVCAHYFKMCKSRKRFALTSLIIGAVLVPLCGIANAVMGHEQSVLNPGWISSENGYYSLSPVNTICALGMILLEMAIIFGVMTLAKGRLHPVLADISRNVMVIYCVHWPIVGLLYPLVYHTANIWFSMALGTVVLAVTLTAVLIWSRKRASACHCAL
jgi:Acyltransferase family.